MTETRFPDRALGTEWMLLELLCDGPLEGSRRELFRQTVQEETLDLPELVEQAARHRLLPMLAYALADSQLKRAVLPQLSNELLVALAANRLRIRELTHAAAQIHERLEQVGVPVAVTKGLVLEPTIYRDAGLRRMNDADLVIHPDNRDDAARVMTELGFITGTYDVREDRIEDLSARARAMYRLSPDHLPHYLRREDSVVTVVDFANSLTWAASEWQVDMAEVLRHRQEVPALAGSVRLPALSPEFLFLSVTLHLFRESWFWSTIERGKDMLYKYADVLRLWKAHRAELTAKLPGLIDRYDLGRPVGWVLVHTDRMFGTETAATLGLESAVSESWLASASGPGGQKLVWDGSMRERLQARDRTRLFRPD